MANRFARTNKFRAKACEYDGHKFDSQGERDYYKHLLTKYPKDDITVHPPSVSLIPTMSWKLDFYIKSENTYVDFKGVETRSFKEKLKVWKSFGPAPLRIVTKTPIIKWHLLEIPQGSYDFILRKTTE